MKLLSATVRNYRIHRETTVEFDDARSLIGGPNESGKSTFIEAVHRGLFLKARVTGDAQKGMVSTLHPGHPEVEVSFSARGKTYRVAKRFSGTSGASQLTEVGGSSWEGDEAESRLNELLKVDEVGGGRNITDRVMQQWSHLWVWQGRGGNDPSADAAAEQTSLLQRLQDEGGAITVQSDRDARVAGHFAQLCDRIFTQAGKPKTGSDLDQVQTELNAAETAQRTAADRMDRLNQAVGDIDDANNTIARCEADLNTLGRQRGEVADEIRAAERLKAQKQQQTVDAARATEELADLKSANDKIDALRAAIQELESSLAPKTEQGAQLQARRQSAGERAQEAAKAYEASLDAVRGIRQRRELARAWVDRFDRDARCRDLRRRTEQASGLRDEIKSLRETLAQLPEIDAEALDGLRDVKALLDQSKAALQAMAAGIEVIKANKAVRIGDKDAETGSSYTVTEPSDVFVGDGVHLRVQPGGGDRLADARDEVRALQDKLARALDDRGLKSLDQAAEAVARRETTQAKLERVESRLDDLDDGSLEEKFGEAQDAMKAADAEVARRSEQVPDAQSPADQNEAVAWQNREEDALVRAETDEKEQKAADQAAKAAVSEVETAVQAISSEIEQQRGAISERQAQLRLLLDDHGNDEARSSVLKEARHTSRQTEAALTETCRLLAELQPDQLERDRDRLERAIKAKDAEKNGAVEKRAGSRAALRLDGSEDPQAELIRANARHQAAREHCESVRRKAEALRLLHRLFQEQQMALADRFTQPLADKISGYLQCLFGPAARAVVTFEDDAFRGIQLVRPDHAGALSFDALSGGTREQVAAAVRLAMAEVLAADHEGSLPVVFDDSFAYSDPDRVQTLQRMLDLAADRGLQVIILTCNPSDYAALGARQVILKPAPAQRTVSSALPVVEREEEANGDTPLDALGDAHPATDDDCEQFMSALVGLGGKSGNHSLRENLGWAEDRYAQVKGQLIALGRVSVPKPVARGDREGVGEE